MDQGKGQYSVFNMLDAKVHKKCSIDSLMPVKEFNASDIIILLVFVTNDVYLFTCGFESEKMMYSDGEIFEI